MTFAERVAAEQARQRAKWGEQEHADVDWLPILVEEVGEVAKALLEPSGPRNLGLNTELIHVAAVVASWLECRLEVEKTS